MSKNKRTQDRSEDVEKPSNAFFILIGAMVLGIVILGGIALFK